MYEKHIVCMCVFVWKGGGDSLLTLVLVAGPLWYTLTLEAVLPLQSDRCHGHNRGVQTADQPRDEVPE